MKKHKISIMLNLATLCLALVAVVFGVYSLKQARMGVNGSLGFVAHDVKANIVTSITGSVAEANATYSKTDKPFKPSGDAGITLNGDTQNISFTRYFSDNGTVNNKPAPIKVSFKITNQSKFDIRVDVSTPTLPTGVTMTTDKSSIKIAQNKSGNITATFYLDSSSTGLTTTPITGLTLELSRFVFKKSDIPVKYKADGLLSNYYIEYGTGKVGSATYALNWFVIGTLGTDGQIAPLDPAKNFTATLSTTGDTRNILNNDVTYAFMSDYILTSGGGTTNGTKYVPFNNNVFYNTKDDKCYSNEYTSVLANDYSISAVRAYLNGKTVNTATDDSTPDVFKPGTTTTTNLNFFTQNTLKDNDIYTLIQPRILDDMYQMMGVSDKSSKLYGNLTPPTAVEGISGTDADAFWLLSQKEADLLWLSDNTKRVGKIQAPNSEGSSSYTASGDSWWLRSPNLSDSSFASYVSSAGITGSSKKEVFETSYGVRPAFLI